MSVLKIRIPNWEKFNPRADRGNFHWYRMQNDFFIDQRVFQLAAEEKLVFVFLLGESSRKNGSEFEISVQYASSLLSLKSSTVLNAVERLSSFQLVACNVFFDANGTERNETERDVRNGTNETEQDGTDLDASSPRPPAALLEIWNSNCGALPKANAVSGRRMSLWKARWAEHPDTEYWIAVVKRISASDFCAGKSDSGWRASLDFLLKPDTHLKTLEGKYDNVVGRIPMTRESAVSASNQALWDRIERDEI